MKKLMDNGYGGGDGCGSGYVYGSGYGYGFGFGCDTCNDWNKIKDLFIDYQQNLDKVPTWKI